MNRIFPTCAAATLLLAAAACPADEVFPVVHNDVISIRILNGKNGSPQAFTHVILTAGYDPRDLVAAQWREEALTDSTGVVHLSNAFRNLPLLEVSVVKRHTCAADPSMPAFSVERIRRDGLIGANRCGALSAEPAPGTLTLFVKGGKASPKSQPRAIASASAAKSAHP